MASEIAGTVAAYRALIGAQLRSQASYRVSFVIDMVSNVGATALDVTTVLVLFRVTRSLGGFGMHEALVMVGLASTAFALADLAVGNIERVRHYVRTGLLDALLLRPLGVLPQLLAVDFTVRRAMRVLFGATVFCVALSRAGVEWTPGRIALAIVAPIAGAVYFSAVFIATATVAFWWIDSGEVASSVTYGGRDFASYPTTVYGGWFRRIFAYGIGFAFVAYYPALALLDERDPLGLPDPVGWLAPLVAPVAALLAWTLWRFGVRQYRSTGS